MVGFSKCYELMLQPVVFEVEEFKMQACKNDDMWPCKAQAHEQTMIDWRRLATGASVASPSQR